MATTQTRSGGRQDAPQAVIDTDDIAQLEAGRALVIQLLQEAHGAEAFGATTLQAHIAMTPASAYRRILERHLRETRDQSERLQRRLGELGVRRSLLASGVGAATTAFGTALALGKGPIDLLRGRAGEEKLFKNVKDEVTTEAQEIVTYEGIEAAARAVGDAITAELAVSIRDEEQRAFDDLRAQVPVLAGAAVRSLVAGDSSFDLSTTGAVQAARTAQESAARSARHRVVALERLRADRGLRRAHREGGQRQAVRPQPRRAAQGRDVREEPRQAHHGARAHQVAQERVARRRRATRRTRCRGCRWRSPRPSGRRPSSASARRRPSGSGPA